MDVKILEKIRDESSTNSKFDLAVKYFTKEHHEYMSSCFNDIIYGISIAGISKAIDYDKKIHGTFEDLGQYLEIKNVADKRLGLIEADVTIDSFCNTIKARSGKAQIEITKTLLSMLPIDLVPWYVRILLKNPRIGMNLTSYNKVREACGMKLIEPFYVKLAAGIEVEELDKLPFPVSTDLKYDGERCLVKVTRKYILLRSRNGKDITHQFPEVVLQFKKFLSKNPSIESVSLDGEIISKSFKQLQQRMGRKSENLNTDNDIKFITFDIIELNGKNLKDKNLNYRLEKLSKLNILTSETFIHFNKFELITYYEKCIENKEEGVVVKDFDSIWSNDRKGWWKIKSTDNLDLMITEVSLGEGKNKDVISRLYVTSKDGRLASWVGSGLTDKDRLYFTKNKDNVIGSIIEIKYNEIIESKEGKLSLRHPRFIRLREDKNEADNVETKE